MARGSIVKKGNNYYVVYYLGRKQRWKAAGPKKKTAEKMLNQITGHLYAGTYREHLNISFDEFALLWLSDYAQVNVKASTYTFYEGIIRLHLAPHFKDEPLAAITTHDVERYLAKKIKEGKLSKTTIGYHLRVLKTVLKRAVLWDYLRTNPAEAVKRPRAVKAEMDFLTPEEIRLFLAEVDDEYYPLFLTAVMTGMRRGELLALKWGDVDWRRSQIFIRRSLWRGSFVSTKSNRSTRTVMMTPVLASTLKRHKVSSPPSEHDLMFCDIEGKPLDSDLLIRYKFHPALRRAGLRKIRFHDLRHTFTSLLISQGENIKFIQSQLGHASIQTTLDRYGHLLPDSTNEVGKRLDETIFKNFLRKSLEVFRNPQDS